MLITRPESRRQSGFAIVSAIFILVALAALGAFIAIVSSAQHLGSALDLDGARAYQSARAGAEWGVANALAGNCASNHIGPLNGMTITVACSATVSGNNVEAGLGAIYTIVATACNFPTAGACPGAVASSNYVERRISVLVEQ
jgi:MSHA biogenesis protein MshP